MLSIKIIPLVFLLLILTACDDTVSPTLPVLPHDPVNEGWKAVENFCYSINTRDIQLMDNSMDTGFHWPLLDESLWDDYNGDGIIDTCFSRDLTLDLFTDLFQGAETLSITLDGSYEAVWYGDSTGQTMQYVRSGEFISEPDSLFFTGVGLWTFLAKPDSTGDWNIWQVTSSVDN